MEKKIIEWLNKTGYPLELNAESILSKKGFRVFNSHYYTDPDKNIPREIDLLAEYSIQDDAKNIEISYNILIECKKSEKPFIILRGKSINTSDFQIGSNYFDKEVMARAILNELETKIELPKPTTSGFKIIQAHTTSDETIHKASNGLFKAFEHWMDTDDELVELYKYDNVHMLIIPILLIQGNIFEAYLDSNNQIQIDEINSANWKFNTGKYRDTFSVIVINERSLSELADSIIKYGTKNIEFLANNPELQLKNIRRKELKKIRKNRIKK